MLPPELTDSIIDNVADDKKTLAACSRVCKTWLPRSRAHLWKTIVLDSSHETMRNLSLFSGILRNSPFLISHIQRLELSYLDHSLADDILAQLSALKGVKTLILALPEVTLKVRDGHTFSASLERLVVSYTTFDNMADWHRLITGLPSLHALSIGSAVQFGRGKRVPKLPSPSQSDPEAEFELRLQKLDIDFANDEQNPIRFWLALLPHIEVDSLSVRRVPSARSSKLDKFWRTALPGVRSFEWDVRPSQSLWNGMATLDLAHTSALSSMTMTVGALDFPIRLSALLRTILPTRPPDAGPLKSLTFVLDKGRRTQALRDAWIILWPVVLALLTGLQQPYDHIVVRVQHPLAWDELLLAGVKPLRDALPLRLEYTTSDGQLCAHKEPQSDMAPILSRGPRVWDCS